MKSETSIMDISQLESADPKDNVQVELMDDKKSLTLKEKKSLRRRKFWIRLIQVSVCTALIPLIFFFVIVPVLICLFPHIMQHLFFLNFRKIPLTDYENVSSNDVRSIGRSLYLEGDEGKIGVWHMLPKYLSDGYRERGIEPSSDEMEATMSQHNYPVVIYAHGNSFDRTISHRCELYNVLNDMNYHVIAFDYRGYGDSEGSPTEEGIVNDTRTVYDYIKPRIGKNTIIIWGHSMGTGVSTKLVMDLSHEGLAPDGLVLESAFNNLRDVVLHHPFSLPIRWLPDKVVDGLIMKPLRSAGLIMESDRRIKDITCPILIMHAADDHVIPAKLGRILKDSAQSAGRNVDYVEFDAKREFRHKFIYMADELAEIVNAFVAKCTDLKS